MKHRLLIVDDDSSMREMLALRLDKRGFTITACASAEEAQKQLVDGDFDALVTDLNLGAGKNGLQLCEWAVANRPRLPVIVITAFGSMDMAIEALRLAEPNEAYGVLRQTFYRFWPVRVTFSGHTRGVTWAEWNADESRVLTASSDGTARVWDAAAGAELLTLSGHTAAVRRAVWNTDETSILTFSLDGTARVWDAATGAELLTLSGHERSIHHAMWDSDERRLIDGLSAYGWGVSWDLGGLSLHWDFGQKWDLKERIGGTETSFWIGRSF